MGTLLVVAASVIVVSVISFGPSALWGSAVARKPNRRPRRWAWKLACAITALWPAGLLLAAMALVDLGVTHKVFGSTPGDNVTFGLIIAVVGAFAVGQLPLTTSLYRWTIVWTLDRAIPTGASARPVFNTNNDLIEAGSRSQSHDALVRVLDALKQPASARPSADG